MSRFKDRIGITYGCLTVVGKNNAGLYFCTCTNCGSLLEVSSGALRSSAKSKSKNCIKCGSNRLKSRIGERFGAYTVISDRDDEKLYKVRCLCGAEKQANINQLYSYRAREVKTCDECRTTEHFAAAAKIGAAKRRGELSREKVYSVISTSGESLHYSYTDTDGLIAQNLINKRLRAYAKNSKR